MVLKANKRIAFLYTRYILYSIYKQLDRKISKKIFSKAKKIEIFRNRPNKIV